VPNLQNGALMLFGADEIQPQKFPEMKTHVSYWTIDMGIRKSSD